MQTALAIEDEEYRQQPRPELVTAAAAGQNPGKVHPLSVILFKLWKTANLKCARSVVRIWTNKPARLRFQDTWTMLSAKILRLAFP